MLADAPARSFLCALFDQTIERLCPARRVTSALEDLDYAAPETTIVALGKAALAMTRGALEFLDGRGLALSRCVTVIPDGLAVPRDLDARVTLFASAHPIPDERSVAAARALLRAVEETPAHGHVLALISGGGSALAALPRPGISLADKLATTRALAERGASIHELNRVRKELSAIKGGRLIQGCRAPVTTLVSSDVVGDDPGTVASGPTVADRESRAQARDIVERSLGWRGVPTTVRAWLTEPDDEHAHAARDPMRDRDRVMLIAGTDALVEACVLAAREAGVDARILASSVAADVDGIAALLADAARRLAAEKPRQRTCLVAGGEATLALSSPHGSGGRAQHLALLVARAIAGMTDISVLVAGSDGIDGNTRAAGAIVDGTTWSRLERAGAVPEEALRGCDSGTALAALGACLITGPTGVNHADLMVVGAGFEPASNAPSGS